MPSPSNLLFFSLITWRLSALLVKERGLFAIFERLRTWAGVYAESSADTINGQLVIFEQPKADSELGQLFLCVWCMSFWIGLLLAKGHVLDALAYSAGAIVIESMVKQHD